MRLAMVWPGRRAWRVLALGLVLCTILLLLSEQQSLNGFRHPAGLGSPTDPITIAPINDLADKTHDEQSVLPDARGRVLVTGGGGMLGKQVIGRLLSVKTPITVLDRIFRDDELEAIRALHPHADLRFVQGDIRDAAKVREAMTRDVKGVIHLAAVPRVAWCADNEADCKDVNVRGTETVLDAVDKAGGVWFLYTSSSAVYGKPGHVPVPESAELKPISALGRTMAAAEDMIQRRVKEADKLNAIVLRLSNVYGSPNDHAERMVPNLMTNALNNRLIQIEGGKQEMDLLFVQDAVNAIAHAVTRLTDKMEALSSRADAYEVFNIGTGSAVPLETVVAKVVHLTNSSSPLQTIPADHEFAERYAADGTLASKQLGFKPQVTLDEGLHRLAVSYLGLAVEYYKVKTPNVCGYHPVYGLKDLWSLDGCSGVLAAEMDGQPFFAEYRMPKDGNPELWEWEDTDEPFIWEFEVQKQKDAALIRLHQHVKDKNNKDDKGKDVDFKTPTGEVSYLARVEPDTGYISLSDPNTGAEVIPWDPREPKQRKRFEPLPTPGPSSLGAFRYRITPFCCPDRQAPWPFFREDPGASGVLDMRLEKRRHFNASQIVTLCTRLQEAEAYAVARLDTLHQYPKPISIGLAPLPKGRPYEWRLRNTDICTSLCDHPLLCVNTGDCACASTSCPAVERFPFADTLNTDRLSYKSLYASQVDWYSVASHNPAKLVDDVAQGSWLNVLRPNARRYLRHNPAFPAINVTTMGEKGREKVKEDPDRYYRLQSEPHGCFSADSVVHRGADLLSKEYKPGSLVFMPHSTFMFEFPKVDEWVDEAMAKYIPDPHFSKADMIVPFTFDWGRCQTILHNLYRIRDWGGPQVKESSAWQNMGDLNSPCYFMDQDVVIPPRTCRSEDLRSAYGAVGDVIPSRRRSALMAFKGSPNGAGAAARAKVACPRPWKETRGKTPKLEDATSRTLFLQRFKPGSDYVGTLGDAVFCPMPRGTAGWSARIADVLYTACIPVLVGDQTHHSHWDMLDWSKFSVQIMDYELDHLEEILMDMSWDQVERLQTNLMLVRDAFLYPAEGDMEQNVAPGHHGPFFYAMHQQAMIQMTRYPTSS